MSKSQNLPDKLPEGCSGQGVLRTPEERFDNLPDYSFTPHYALIPDKRFGSLRMHYLDEGDRNAPVVLLLHGEPSWSYLYRHMIEPFVAAGYRAVAPDMIGFGRSDKLIARTDYSYQHYIDWLAAFIDVLDLNNVILVCQDWGGPIGLSTLVRQEERFVAIVVANTLLPNCLPPPAGVAGWPGEIIENWVAMTKTADDLPVGEIVSAVCVNPLPPPIKLAYDAPFPDASYKAAVLEFPSLIPIAESMPGCEENRRVWARLKEWHKPLLTAFSDGDPSTKAWEAVFQQQIPGAAGAKHLLISGAGHFLQEEQGEQLAAGIIERLADLFDAER